MFPNDCINFNDIKVQIVWQLSIFLQAFSYITNGFPTAFNYVNLFFTLVKAFLVKLFIAIIMKKSLEGEMFIYSNHHQSKCRFSRMQEEFTQKFNVLVLNLWIMHLKNFRLRQWTEGILFYSF